jgi:hypothetical protein
MNPPSKTAMGVKVRKKTLSELKPETQQLVDMLLANDYVGNFGGIVMGNKTASKDKPMSVEQLRRAIEELDTLGIKVRRFDSGGLPKWALED